MTLQRPRGEKPYTKEEERLMFKLFKEGNTPTEIAKHFPHRPIRGVKNKCQRMGLTSPNRG